MKGKLGVVDVIILEKIVHPNKVNYMGVFIGRLPLQKSFQTRKINRHLPKKRQQTERKLLNGINCTISNNYIVIN